ncbi:PREDICTED: keratin-associated protein 26-1-like [Chrysochloris asiatica]|uniref:Keratin-associated protein n=1 Tax=Chrysochloris asiatica TaxID=185453 RepID=A0A9B0TJA8_CHRAS|nr:PREDICTED: keratin-associated protein 26-1-like [Chrysochloris asiatica]
MIFIEEGSRNYSIHSLGNSGYVPVTSPSALCSTEVSCGDALYSPTSSLGSNTLHDNCHEPCREPMSCKATSCENHSFSATVCSPIKSDVSRPVQGTGCFPIMSHGSWSCHPVSCRQPLSFYHSFDCQPPNYFSYDHQPLRYLPYNRQPLSNLSYNYQPLSYMSNCYRPINYTYSTFHPYSCSFSGW